MRLPLPGMQEHGARKKSANSKTAPGHGAQEKESAGGQP